MSTEAAESIQTRLNEIQTKKGSELSRLKEQLLETAIQAQNTLKTPTIEEIQKEAENDPSIQKMKAEMKIQKDEDKKNALKKFIKENMRTIKMEYINKSGTRIIFNCKKHLDYSKAIKEVDSRIFGESVESVRKIKTGDIHIPEGTETLHKQKKRKQISYYALAKQLIEQETHGNEAIEISISNDDIMSKLNYYELKCSTSSRLGEFEKKTEELQEYLTTFVLRPSKKYRDRDIYDIHRIRYIQKTYSSNEEKYELDAARILKFNEKYQSNICDSRFNLDSKLYKYYRHQMDAGDIYVILIGKKIYLFGPSVKQIFAGTEKLVRNMNRERNIYFRDTLTKKIEEKERNILIRKKANERYYNTMREEIETSMEDTTNFQTTLMALMKTNEKQYKTEIEQIANEGKQKTKLEIKQNNLDKTKYENELKKIQNDKLEEIGRENIKKFQTFTDNFNTKINIVLNEYHEAELKQIEYRNKLELTLKKNEKELELHLGMLDYGTQQLDVLVKERKKNKKKIQEALKKQKLDLEKTKKLIESSTQKCNLTGEKIVQTDKNINQINQDIITMNENIKDNYNSYISEVLAESTEVARVENDLNTFVTEQKAKAVRFAETVEFQEYNQEAAAAEPAAPAEPAAEPQEHSSSAGGGRKGKSRKHLRKQSKKTKKRKASSKKTKRKKSKSTTKKRKKTKRKNRK